MEHAKQGLFWVCIDPKKIKEGLEKYLRFTSKFFKIIKLKFYAKT